MTWSPLAVGRVTLAGVVGDAAEATFEPQMDVLCERWVSWDPMPPASTWEQGRSALFDVVDQEHRR